MICDICSSESVSFMVSGTVLNSLINENSIGVSCQVVDFLYFPFNCQFLMVTVVIFDCSLHIKEPFKNREIMTKKVAAGLVISCWVITFFKSI